jgi:hypothetical protein
MKQPHQNTEDKLKEIFLDRDYDLYGEQMLELLTQARLQGYKEGLAKKGKNE